MLTSVEKSRRKKVILLITFFKNLMCIPVEIGITGKNSMNRPIYGRKCVKN